MNYTSPRVERIKAERRRKRIETFLLVTLMIVVILISGIK